MSMGCALLDQLTLRTYDQGSTHVVELDVTDDIRGPTGAVHGGIIASLVDRAGAFAAVQASGQAVVTSNVALSYLASATMGPLRVSAQPLRVGRRQGVVQVQVHDEGEGARLVASALLTVSIVAPAPRRDGAAAVASDVAP